MPSAEVPDITPTSTAWLTRPEAVRGGARARTTPPASASARSASARDKPSCCITIAVLTLPPAASMSRRASSRSTPVTSITIRSPRSTSFALIARRSTIRFPNVLPRRIIAPVEMALSTSFVAVPAFMRVEPVTASGPVMGTNRDVDELEQRGGGGGEQARMPVWAPSAAARSSAATHVRRGAARGDAEHEVARAHVPRVHRCGAVGEHILRALLRLRERRDATGDDPLHHLADRVPNVGGHSLASSTPSRPEVPAPM